MKRILDYYKDTHIFAGLSVSLFLNVVSWVLLSWKLFSLQSPEVVLHYNVYFGPDKIGPAWHAAYVPLIGLVCLIINFCVGLYLWNVNKIISYVFNYFSVILQILTIVSVIFTILANL